MLNWFDLMRQAQTSAGFDTLTRQFQLSGDQAQRAMLAFMPAFAMGLQQAMLSPQSNPFLQTLTSATYQNLWHTAGRAFSPQAQHDGRRLLDLLFGSDEASRRIAHQAADFTGLSADLMQQMLPLLAGIFAGSLHQWMMSRGGMLEAFAPPSKEKKSAAAADPWLEMWTGWMKTAPSEPKAKSPYEELTASFLGMSPQIEPPPQKSTAPPSWGDMMETGREMQIQYLTSLQSIFEDVWKTNAKKS